jgi:hypothetical protein
VRLIEKNEKISRVIATRKDHIESIQSPIPSQNTKTYIVDKNPSKCRKTNHPEYYCADHRANHYPEYLISGNFEKLCGYCNALLLKSENSSLCCSNGQVKLPDIPRPPIELELLFNNLFGKQDSEHFLTHTRIYNGLVAFGYVTCGMMEFNNRPKKCAPVILINGEIYHYITGKCLA